MRSDAELQCAGIATEPIARTNTAAADSFCANPTPKIPRRERGKRAASLAFENVSFIFNFFFFRASTPRLGRVRYIVDNVHVALSSTARCYVHTYCELGTKERRAFPFLIYLSSRVRRCLAVISRSTYNNSRVRRSETRCHCVSLPLRLRLRDRQKTAARPARSSGTERTRAMYHFHLRTVPQRSRGLVNLTMESSIRGVRKTPFLRLLGVLCSCSYNKDELDGRSEQREIRVLRLHCGLIFVWVFFF